MTIVSGGLESKGIHTFSTPAQMINQAPPKTRKIWYFSSLGPGVIIIKNISTYNYFEIHPPYEIFFTIVIVFLFFPPWKVAILGISEYNQH